MQIKVETATIKLLDKMLAIEKQSFGKEAFTRQHIVYLMSDYNAVALAARVNDEIEGFVIARIDTDGNLPLGHILTLDVSPSHRRKGIAQKLLRETEALLKQKGVNECRLEVREDNVAAITLYRKLGYKKIGNSKNTITTRTACTLRKSYETSPNRISFVKLKKR